MAHQHYSEGYGPVGPAPQEHSVVYTTLHFDKPWSYDNYLKTGGYSAWRRILAEKKLGCKLGESTADGRVYLKREEECLAACCGAPVVVINGHYHEKLDPAKVDELLDGLE